MESCSSPRVVAKGNNDTKIPSIMQHLPLKVTEVSKETIKNFAHTKRVGNYLLGRTLGEGSFAKVKEGLHVLTGEKVAIKVVDKKRAKEDSYVRKNMRREGKLLQMVHHPNIIRLYEIMETENSYYLVTELCRGGDFMEYICQKKRLNEKEVKKYIRQIISAVDYLHRLGILHRDLKVENLLLDENGDIKLIDFGLSNSIRGSTMREGQRMQEFCVTQCGSPAYAAPELLGHKHYGTKVDAWSIGVNMYAMLTGSLPFTVEPFNIKTLHNKMLTGQMNPVPDYLTRECRDLLRKFLTPDPEKRLSLGDAMKHPWVSEGKNRPLEPIPCPNRIRSEEICDDILHHMSDFHGYRISDVMRHVTSNMPGPQTAMYHLFKHRLDKYKALQRVRGKVPANEVRNKENRMSLLLKKPANVVAGQAQTAIAGPVTPGSLQKVRNRRPGRIHMVKEDTLEPKIIELKISTGVSLDVQESPRNIPQMRTAIKVRKRESKMEQGKTKEQEKHLVEKDIVLIDMSPGDPVKNIHEEIKNKDSSSSHEPSPRTVSDESKQVTTPVSGMNKANPPTPHVIGTKYTGTILSELLPKQAHLRQRLYKHVTHHQALREFRKTVDRNNNNLSSGTTMYAKQRKVSVINTARKLGKTGPPESSQSPITLKPEDKEVSVGQ
ncbi:hormonally up-regulated neu tumor-associated kinase homolog A-like [Liolophura sinensis]|uniref:hormonally up-regulated neu tumor-associated kinase homolog A-like n=1 Tax=Liolophura sinensis TaxID=3198878 RepID=UPI0031582B04